MDEFRAREAKIKVRWQRLRDCAHWLITMGIHPEHESEFAVGASWPQARAVVDDFGNLVIVRRWI